MVTQSHQTGLYAIDPGPQSQYQHQWTCRCSDGTVGWYI